MIDNDISGVNASIRIFYVGTMHELAGVLAAAFNIDGFLIEQEEYDPFDEVGFAEALGFEAWLRPLSCDGEAWFSLELVTDHSIEEIINGRMYNISNWLARYVSDMCKVQAVVGPSKEVG